MSAFDSFDADLSSAIEEEFGDTAVLLPMIPSEYGVPVADTARPTKPVVGVFSSGPVVGKLDRDSRGQGANSKRSSEVPVFWLSAEQVAAIGYEIRVEDRLTIAGRATAFRVAAILPTNQGDLELHLTY